MGNWRCFKPCTIPKTSKLNLTKDDMMNVRAIVEWKNKKEAAISEVSVGTRAFSFLLKFPPHTHLTTITWTEVSCGNPGHNTEMEQQLFGKLASFSYPMKLTNLQTGFEIVM